MKELGVTNEQFLAACERAEQNPIHKKIVDQIVAVDNFLAFKKLMVKRNQYMNQQAIELFEKMKQKQLEKPTPGAEKAEESKDADKSAEVVTGTPVPATAGTTPGLDKKQADELKEVMRVAQQIERAEEAALMKKALEESEKQAELAKNALNEEEEMLKRAIEESQREENDRLQRQKTLEQQEQDKIAVAQRSSDAENEIAK